MSVGKVSYLSATRIVTAIAAAAFIAIAAAASLTGGDKPKPCEDFLNETLAACDMAKGNLK